MKKIISVILSVLMIISVCPVAFAGNVYSVTFKDLEYAKKYRTDAIGREGYTLGKDYWFTYVDKNNNTVTVKDADTVVECEENVPFVFNIVTADYVEASTVRGIAYPDTVSESGVYNSSTGAPKSDYCITENDAGNYAVVVKSNMNITISEYHLCNTGFKINLPSSKYYNVVRLDKTDKGDIGYATGGTTKRYTYLVTLEGFDITAEIQNNVAIDADNANDNMARINAINAEQNTYDAEDYFTADKSALKTIRYDRDTFDQNYYYITYTNSSSKEVTEKWHLKVERVNEAMTNCAFTALTGSSFTYLQSITSEDEYYYHTVDPRNDSYVVYTHQSLYFMVSLTVAGVNYAYGDDGKLTMNVAISQKVGDETVKKLLEPVWTAPDGLTFIYCIEDCAGDFSVSVNNAYGFSISMIKEIITSLKAGDFDFGDLLSGNGSVDLGDTDVSGITSWLLRMLSLIGALLRAFGLSVDLSGITEKIQNIGK